MMLEGYSNHGKNLFFLFIHAFYCNELLFQPIRNTFYENISSKTEGRDLIQIPYSHWLAHFVGFICRLVKNKDKQETRRRHQKCQETHTVQ